MRRKYESARDIPSCEIVIYRDTPFKDDLSSVIDKSSVVFVDNRGREGQYHHVVTDEIFQPLRNGSLKTSNEQRANELLRAIIKGVKEGRLRDFTQVAKCLGTVNYYANFESLGIKPFKLVVINAEDHIAEMIKLIIERKGPKIRPAGFILGGSPKMLSLEKIYKSSVIKQTKRLIVFCLRHEIPIFGICFGFHLLSWAKFNIRPDWIRVPKNMTVEFHPRWKARDKFTTGLSSGQRYSIFGTSLIRRAKKHPVMAAVDRVLALKVHSQYIDPGRLNEKQKGSMLAVSERLFRETKNSKAKTQIKQKIVEVMSFGPVAAGSQGHGEMSSELLYALAHSKSVSGPLEDEGHNMERILDEVIDYPTDSLFAGVRILYNFVKRILAPDYIRSLGLNDYTENMLFERLIRRKPSWWGNFGILSRIWWKLFYSTK